MEFIYQNIHLLALLSIPIISGLVGWGTNVLAIKMTFYPVKYIGVKPFGWQGIIPAKSELMASKSVDLMLEKLLSVEEQFDKIDPAIVAEEMAPSLHRLTRQIINETMMEKSPKAWKLVPDLIKNKIAAKFSQNLPEQIAGMMVEVKSHINDFWDVKEMVIKALTKDKNLLNNIFMEVGEKEFKFIEKSGFYFGALFGVIQMFIWHFLPIWWILPLGGLVIGFITNWLALKLIFSPQKPINIFGIKIQGLFIKRQKNVAESYSAIVTENILTSKNIAESITEGGLSKNVAKVTEVYVRQGIKEAILPYKSYIDFVLDKKELKDLQQKSVDRFLEELPWSLRYIFDYAEKALDLENTLREKMSNLSPQDFVGFLRPVFQEDEVTLIIVGGFLGLLAGFLQLLLLF